MHTAEAMDPVYLDYAATTPVRDEVREAMEPYLAAGFGNPSSIHRWGREAHDALEGARSEIASVLGVRSSEVAFVRGGTESDNLAVLGWCEAWKARGEMPTLVVSAIEHHAVLEAADYAGSVGLARVHEIDVRPDGGVDLDELRQAVSSAPALVSVMWVNNECGIELPMPAIAAVAQEAGATLHSDAAQAVGKVSVDLADVPVDLLSGTGHKIHAPKGTGFLVAREGTPMAPRLHGGGQERGVRPGTEDVAGAVGLAAAVRLSVTEREDFADRIGRLRDRMQARLTEALDGIRINAGEACRAPHVLSVGISGVEDGSALVMALDLEGVAVSGGSACTSGAAEASHVMQALYGPDDPFATVRFSFGKDSVEEDVDRAVEATVTVVRRMRSL